MLMQDIQDIKADLKIIKTFIANFPEWIPITESIAQEYGYKGVDGFRNYCIRNLHPSLFQKRGRIYHIHISALALLKK